MDACPKGSHCEPQSESEHSRFAVQVDNKLVLQVLRAMEKKGNTYRTSQGRAKGVSRIVHHTLEEEKKKELISNMIDTSYFAVMSLPEFFGGAFNSCGVVLQIYPMTSAKEDVALGSGLWCITQPLLASPRAEPNLLCKWCPIIRLGWGCTLNLTRPPRLQHLCLN